MSLAQPPAQTSAAAPPSAVHGELSFRGYRLSLVYLRITDAEPARMLIITENRKLMRPGLKRLLARHGYAYRGRERRGLDIWLARS